MRSICMECGILFNVKEPFSDDRETHGICDECFPMVMSKIDAYHQEKQKEVNSND